MEIVYEDKVVAFIDVLGFSNLVYGNDTKLISQYYDTILTDFNKAASKNNLKFLLISDSIVIHAPLTKKEFLTTVKVVNDLQHRLLQKGILMRGGISFGKLYADDVNNIIVGTGMVNAYNLETKAKYPRIIIDRRFVTLFWKNSLDFLKNSARLIRLTPPNPYVQDYPYIDIGKAVSFDFQPTKFEAVNKTLQVNYYSNEHIEKYEWLKRNILEGVKASLAYLESKEVKSKNEPKRIRLLTEFINTFEKN